MESSSAGQPPCPGSECKDRFPFPSESARRNQPLIPAPLPPENSFG